ncbi:MAG: amidohydrolase family protein, partial [bacterium]
MGDTVSPTFLLRSRRIVTPHGVIDGTILIANGIITSVDQLTRVPPDDVLDVGDLVVSPGLVDPHVHMNEPGRTEWEGFETATRAAAAGGITTLVDMPLNSSPVTTTVESFKTKLAAAQRKLFVDCGFHAGLVPSNAHSIG